MTRHAWRWVGGGAVVAALATLLATSSSTVVGEQQVDRNEQLARLGPGRVGATFPSLTSGLTEIDLVVTSEERPAPAARFRLRDVTAGADRIDQMLPRRLPGGHEYVRVRFAPLWDSQARTYEVSIERVAPRDPGWLVVWGRSAATPAGDGLTGDAVLVVGGDLAFRAWHRVTGWVALRTFLERWAATGLGAWLWAAGLVAVGYGAGLRVLLGGLRS